VQDLKSLDPEYGEKSGVEAEAFLKRAGRLDAPVAPVPPSLNVGVAFSKKLGLGGQGVAAVSVYLQYKGSRSA